MFYVSSNPKHSISAEMNQVHQAMIKKYNLEREATADIVKAKIMTKYLRAFKNAGLHPSKGTSQNLIQTSLETQAMEQISQNVGKALGIGRYSLFRNQHFWYKDKQSEWGADDVFEAELKEFLNIAVKKAIQKKKHFNKNNQAIIIGNLTSNISESLREELKQNMESIIEKNTEGTEIITNPQFRPGKIDVMSFNGIIEADIRPEWKEFIQAFQGARFTVKNYSSNSKMEVIHLGNTNISKSIPGALEDILGPSKEKEILHIFFHSLKYANKNTLIGQHILHLRFAYELAGGGLYDRDKNKLDAADFFVYNDPSSENIYVRSTKAMIADAIKYTQGLGDPLHSDIIILKSVF